MRALYIALTAEGVTDRRFLPRIIERTVTGILTAHRGEIVEVNPVWPVYEYLDTTGRDGAQTMREAARLACEYQILIVHADSDAQTYEEALQSRFEPGRSLIEADSQECCRTLIPLIPVRMTEAWILADWQLLMDYFRVEANDQKSIKRSLRLPVRPHQTEAIANPKQVVNEFVSRAQSHLRRGRRRIEIGELYEYLAENICLEKLQQVPAYQEFVRLLVEALWKMHLLA